jgi:3-oxoacyl-[acyl-carrier protein] reductase
VRRGCGISGRLTGRVALVTGGAEGIGHATCLRLAQEGAAVAVHYRSREGAARATVRKIADLGGRAMAVKADLAIPAQATEMCEAVRRGLGTVELLVNNAGRYRPSVAEEETPEHLEGMLRDNLHTLFNATWAARASMLDKGFGRIVNVASAAAFFRSPGTPPAYGAAKAAVVAFTKAWAAAWGAKNVRVNCVSPGFIDTEANDAVGAGVRERLVGQTPLGRVGEPEEVADAIAFLLSEEAAFVNGQTLSVCGGRMMLP